MLDKNINQEMNFLIEMFFKTRHGRSFLENFFTTTKD